jgi:hypothetical protein
MRGTFKRLSVGRRMIADLMRYGEKIPAVPAERRMNLSALVAARQARGDRVPWTGIFIKAFALTAQEVPALRQVYMGVPWGHLYEYRATVASLAIERADGAGEPISFGFTIADPVVLSLEEIGRRIRDASQASIESVPDFRHYMLMGRLPALLRRPLWWLAFNIAPARAWSIGTFGVSVVTNLGVDLVQTITLWTALLSYGPLAANGTLDVRLTFDHRVMDGGTAARALVRLEEVLNGEVLRELQSNAEAPPLAASP